MNTNAAPAATFPRAHHPELADYLQERVRATPNGCWDWTRGLNIDGYGQAGIRSHGTSLAHRLAFKCAMGDLPPEPYVIRHRCDNRRCCRPDHLAAGTVAENNRDIVERGRWRGPTRKRNGPKGERNPNAKLTERDVHAIRASSETAKALAGLYGVTDVLIRLIRRRRIWAHVG
jgi:hypothetical protein